MNSVRATLPAGPNGPLLLRALRAVRALGWFIVAGGSMAVALAQASKAPAVTPAKTQAPASEATRPAWSELNPARQQALAPLRAGWDQIDVPRKLKWVEVADRFPHMPPEERQRVQQRMAAWAAMTPTQRARARLQFQETRRITPEERRARWLEYQALPESERQRLAQAARKASAPAAAGSGNASPADAPGDAAKRNVVGNAPSPAPRSVAPTVVQAKPGASTTTVATPAKPPLHHQPGLPKIVATPGFVDPHTLLPKRGPQAAAMRAAASNDPTRQP